MKNSRNLAPEPGPSVMRAPLVMRESKLGDATSGVHGDAQLPNGVTDSDEYGAAHDPVSDVQLFDLRNRRDRTDVVGREPVAGVGCEPDGRRVPRRAPERSECLWIVGVMRVGACMELHGDRAQSPRLIDGG